MTKLIAICGPSGCGKTALVQKLHSGEFIKKYIPPSGNPETSLNFNDIEYKIVEIGGQLYPKQLSTFCLKFVDGVILMIDLTSMITYKQIDEWLVEINRQCEKKVPIVICGNKSDVRDAKVKREHVDKYLIDFPWINTSAKTGDNCETLFQDLIRELSLKS